MFVKIREHLFNKEHHDIFTYHHCLVNIYSFSIKLLNKDSSVRLTDRYSQNMDVII